MSVAPHPLLSQISDLFRNRGQAAYLGEPVTQTEHALQTAHAAEQAGAGSALIAAALLHDIGHLLDADSPDPRARDATDFRHEDSAAHWLAQHFGPELVEPVRLHVAAKRYLCATDPAYYHQLSEASRASLRLQKGPFTPEEARHFEQGPHFRAALALRRWDEAAKIAGLPTPGIAHFLKHVEAALVT
jgi:phosphonate degradation associated HDIG domain protein